MKKIFLFLIMGLVAVSLAACDPCKENMLTDLGDKMATIGKDDVEKNKVLAERKANRASKCAEKQGGDLKKGLGF